MNGKTFGLDLGTKRIKIFRQPEGIVLKQVNQIAIEGKNKILSFGDEAYDMYEKAPDNIHVSYPMKNGVIADFSDMKELLQLFITKTGMKGLTGSKEFYIAVPTDITDVEKRAFFDLVRSTNLHAKKIHVVEKPVADALGAGIEVNSPRGVMVVNIGGDTTEITVMSLGGIVLSKLIQIGGNKIDEAIVAFVKKQENVIIGMKSAEKIKMEIAHAMNKKEASLKVMGRDVVTGLPVEVDVKSDMVYHAMKDYLYSILDAIKVILERTPPELSSDIIDDGIFVTGGCSLIDGLDELIKEETDLSSNFFEDPENTVITGLGRIIEDPSLQNLAFSSFQPNYY